jgi:hypothetical protein
VDITYTNISAEPKAPSSFEGIRAVDDRGNACDCSCDVHWQSELSPSTHAFTRFNFNAPPPGFKWIRIEIPVSDFGGRGTHRFVGGDVVAELSEVPDRQLSCFASGACIQHETLKRDTRGTLVLTSAKAEEGHSWDTPPYLREPVFFAAGDGFFGPPRIARR